MSRLLCVLVFNHVCLFGSAYLVSGLRCYSCSGPKCALGDDSRQLQPVVCPPSTNDMLVMCLKISTSGQNDTANYYHDCVEMPRGSAQACATSSDLEKSWLNKLLDPLGIDVQNFAGQFCVCATDNCNGQGKLLAEKLVWIAGLVLAVLGSQRW